MTIIDGSVCAPYPQEVYVYWKVRFAGGSTAWMPKVIHKALIRGNPINRTTGSNFKSVRRMCPISGVIL